jgi:hypothetical protein
MPDIIVHDPIDPWLGNEPRPHGAGPMRAPKIFRMSAAAMGIFVSPSR